MEKFIFFVVSMLILIFLFRWSLSARDSKSRYVSFPNKIERFR